MFIDIAPYLEYGHNQTWGGLAPVHWKQATMRAVARERTVSGVPGEPLLSVSIKHGVTTQAALLSESSKRDGSNLDRSAYKLVEPGDIAYNKMRAWQGAAGMSRFRGIVSPAYVVLRPVSTIMHPLYLHHLLRLPEYAAEAARWSYGITSDQWSLRPEHFRLIPVNIPPLEEQEGIVTYLAHAHQRINQAIAAKRRLLELLGEQERAIIGEAVTQGVNRTRPMRATGLAFMSTVPAHWTVAQLGRFWDVTDCKHLTVPFTEDGVPLASVRQAQRFFLSFEDSRRTSEEWAAELCSDGRSPRRGDIVYCRNVGVGASALVDTDEFFAMGQDVCLLRSSTQDPTFFNYFLRSPSMKEQLNRTLLGATFRRINVGQIRSLTIVAPPIEEQRAIVRHLELELAPIRAVRERTRREIELMKEFRVRLDTDVVTGQADVRAIASTLTSIDPSQLLPDSDGIVDDDGEEVVVEGGPEDE